MQEAQVKNEEENPDVIPFLEEIEKAKKNAEEHIKHGDYQAASACYQLIAVAYLDIGKVINELNNDDEAK